MNAAWRQVFAQEMINRVPWKAEGLKGLPQAAPNDVDLLAKADEVQLSADRVERINLPP